MRLRSHRVVHYGLLSISVFLSSCGTSALSGLVDALPAIAVASPTASDAAETFFLVNSSRDLTEEQVDAPKLGDAVEGFNQLSQLPPAEAAGQIKLKVRGRNNNCYGQGAPYTNHPDGGPDGSTLGGDTGFDSETETVEGETVACPAATLNAKIAQLTGLVNEALKLNYLGAAAAAQAGKALPTETGGSVEVAIDGVPGMSDGELTISKVADVADGYTTHTWSITGTFTDGADTGSMLFTLTHAKKSDTDYKGLFVGRMPRGDEYYGFSLVYSVQGTTATYELKSSETQGAPGYSDLFKTDSTLDLSPSTGRQNMVVGYAALDTATGLGSVIFAWNAGKNDPRSRIFQAKTEAGSPDTGFAYFGFGDPVNETNFGSGSLQTINGMICAWTAGDDSFLSGDMGAEHAGLAQGMQMERDATSGEFVPVSGQVKISYCPTNSCDGAGGMTYDGAACTASANLATTTEYGTISVTAPSFP